MLPEPSGSPITNGLKSSKGGRETGEEAIATIQVGRDGGSKRAMAHRDEKWHVRCLFLRKRQQDLLMTEGRV